jgi:hypothetical protein
VADKNALRSFERRTLTKIFGRVWGRVEWRVRYNMELNELTEGYDIVRFVKAQRIRWLKHGERTSRAQMSKSTEGEIILQMKKGTTMYKTAEQCGDGPYDDGVRGWR